MLCRRCRLARLASQSLCLQQCLRDVALGGAISSTRAELGALTLAALLLGVVLRGKVLPVRGGGALRAARQGHAVMDERQVQRGTDMP